MKAFYLIYSFVNCEWELENRETPPADIGTPVKSKPLFSEVLYYPQHTLDEYEAAGMDISEMRVANEAQSAHMFIRGLNKNAVDWDIETADGLIGADY